MPTFDVVAVTVRPKDELQALLWAFGIADDVTPGYSPTRDRRWHATVETAEGRELSVLITAIGEAGNVDAGAFVASLIAEFSPGLVALVGIAAGVLDRTRLGDVVAARAVLGFEPQRLEPDRSAPRHLHVPAPIRIATDLVHFDPRAREGGWFVLYQECLQRIHRDEGPDGPPLDASA